MADKAEVKPATATPAAPAPAGNQQLATTGTMALTTGMEAAPDYFDKGDRRGFEDTAQSDVQIPRLSLAQMLSPEVTEGDPRLIEGLKAGQLFNSVTKKSYGSWCVVQLLRKMPLRAMEFNPIDDGGGVADPNVPLDDPRLKWGPEGEKPVATLFRDFIARVLESDAQGVAGPDEIIALSFKSSGIAVAKQMWGMAMMLNKPCFAPRIKLSSAQRNDPKPHKIWVVERVGWVSLQDKLIAEQVFEAVGLLSAEKIDRTGDHAEDPTAFDTDRMEREAEARAAGEPGGM